MYNTIFVVLGVQSVVQFVRVPFVLFAKINGLLVKAGAVFQTAMRNATPVSNPFSLRFCFQSNKNETMTGIFKKLKT